MRNKFTLKTEPEKLRLLLNSFKSDHKLRKCFEGQIEDGVIKGEYTRLAQLNKLVISYTKVSGTYNIEKGELSITTHPSKLFYVITFCSILGFTICGFHVNERVVQIAIALIAFLLVFSWSLSSYLEGRALISRLKMNFK
ncbi:hypothetical protein [Salibacter halophilus]|uniref:Uncharacterized protein n=1 Tax=Salibacter halophilus TaxID=1803916 RepID=A0A6N6M9T2_9FLAO|nr:hypothetical protein [Salibacter halophilus]KAB1065911.1 hypothetical protein F3059_00110 [Salibacter halophilus]